MEVINTYLENVFAAYPQTGEVLAIKRDMLANMEEKFHALLKNGKTEHEAAYGVIADFGNIEEITAELGLSAKTYAAESGIPIKLADARDYLAKTRNACMLIGLGVWLIIAGVSLAESLGAVVLFSAVAAAVTLFIVSGHITKEYEHYEKTRVSLDPAARAQIEKEHKKASLRGLLTVALGIAVMLIAVGAQSVYEYHYIIFLNIIGFAVFLFITGGARSSYYEILLNKGGYADKEAAGKTGRIIGTIAAVYWPVVLAVYISLNFVRNAWDRSWVIWPAAALIFGAVAGGVAVWREAGGKDKA